MEDLITSVTRRASGGRAVRGTKERVIVGQGRAIQGRRGELLEAKGEDWLLAPLRTRHSKWKRRSFSSSRLLLFWLSSCWLLEGSRGAGVR